MMLNKNEVFNLIQFFGFIVFIVILLEVWMDKKSNEWRMNSQEIRAYGSNYHVNFHVTKIMK